MRSRDVTHGKTHFGFCNIDILSECTRSDDIRKIVDGLAIEFKSIYFAEGDADSVRNQFICEPRIADLSHGRRKRRPGQLMQSSDFVMCPDIAPARKCPRRADSVGRGARAAVRIWSPAQEWAACAAAAEPCEIHSASTELPPGAATRASGERHSEALPAADASAASIATASCTAPGADGGSAYFDELAAVTAAAR